MSNKKEMAKRFPFFPLSIYVALRGILINYKE
jgi:hypothetical protein